MQTRDNGVIIFPPGEPLKFFLELTKSGEVTVRHMYSDNPPPLVPLAEAKALDANTMSVRATIFINSTAKDPQLLVSQVLCVTADGEFKLQFFIHCGEEEVYRLIDNRTEEVYTAYETQFESTNTNGFPDGITMESISHVQVFLWNIDPETSRGTESVVQTAN